MGRARWGGDSPVEATQTNHRRVDGSRMRTVPLAFRVHWNLDDLIDKPIERAVAIGNIHTLFWRTGKDDHLRRSCAMGPLS